MGFFYFRNRFGEQWVSHCQITAFFPPRSHKSWTPTKHLEHVVLPINDFIRRWPVGHSWNTVRYSCTADSLSHSKNHPNEGLNKDKVIAASHTFIGKSTVSYCTNISATLLGLRSTVETHHSMILFVRSKAWREGLRRPPAFTYVPEPRERASEKARRINLQLLQLSRHTLLYLFNHTSLLEYKKF